MQKFYIFIAVLLEEYEPKITEEIKKRGWTIVNGELQQNIISSQKALSYTMISNQNLDRVEYDLCYSILEELKMKYHFCLVSNAPFGFRALWRGSNINYDNIKLPHLTAITPNKLLNQPPDKTIPSINEDPLLNQLRSMP